MAVLTVQNLTMRFGGLTAVKNLDLSVEQGQIFSVIGPNGAGKTTVFNAVTGVYNPTEGHVLFMGRRLRKPFTWKVAVGCAIIGLLTAAFGFLISLNVDRMWKAGIKREYARNGDDFSYAAAVNAAIGYYHGDLAIEKERQIRPGRPQRWVVKSPDGGQTLAKAKTEIEADRLRAELAAGNLQIKAPVAAGGEWEVRNAAGSHVIDTFDSEESAQEFLALLEKLLGEQETRRRTAFIVAVGGLLFGALGSFAIWRRCLTARLHRYRRPRSSARYCRSWSPTRRGQ